MAVARIYAGVHFQVWDNKWSRLQGRIHRFELVTPNARVPLGRSPKYFYRKVADYQATKWHRNIAEHFNRLSRVHERYRQTDDRRTTDGRTTTYKNEKFANRVKYWSKVVGFRTQP